MKDIAELCSGSTGDFESLSPGSNPGSAAILFLDSSMIEHNNRKLIGTKALPSSSVVERAAVNRLVVGSNPTSGAI